LRLKDAVAALERDLVRARETDEVLGAGAYGRIFKAKDATTGELVAVKVVNVADEDVLKAEFSLLRTLSADDSRCFPKPLWCGRQTVMGQKARVMVMNLLGESLEQISQRVTMGTGFSRCTTARVAKRLFTALEACHRNGVVHGDVKPDNLLTEIHVGGARRTGIVLVDFGEAIRFDDDYVARLNEDVSRQDWRGTLLFSSPNVDAGAKMAPRDDLESAIYTLAYLRTGRLPWSRALDTDEREVDVRELAKAKRAVDSGAALLTPFGVDDGRVPDDYEDDVDFFERVLSHARSLRAADSPDYDFLQRSVAEWRDGSDEPYEWARDP
jgi:casein kinase 1